MNSVNLPRPITQGMSPQNMQAQFNNAYAAALAQGDPRYALKNYDRGGLSRGGAQMNQAGIDAANSLAEGIAQAYAQNAQNEAYNANTRLQAQQGVEQNAQELGGFQASDAYQRQMEQLARQQSLNNMAAGVFSSPTMQAPQLSLGGLLNAPAMGAPQFSLPDPAQQLAGLRQADNSLGLLGGLLQR